MHLSDSINTFRLRRLTYGNFHIYQNNLLQRDKVYIILNYEIILT